MLVFVDMALPCACLLGRPLYIGDDGFGEGIDGYAAGVFPGDHVTKPP